VQADTGRLVYRDHYIIMHTHNMTAVWNWRLCHYQAALRLR